MIVTTVNFDEFVHLFKNVYKRDNYSYEGYRFLFDYLESYSDDIGEDYRLDVIGICCDFYEYTLEEIKREYDIVSECETMDEVVGILNDETIICGFNDDVIVFQSF